MHTAFGFSPISEDGGKTGCSAFGGEGTGGHCGAPLPNDSFMWEVGTRYTFAVEVSKASTSFHGMQGAVWHAAVTNENSAKVTDIGSIFVRDDF
eukprot:SAG31_NODE_34407_length_333_cov_0.876068_1_plen_93_part_01